MGIFCSIDKEQEQEYCPMCPILENEILNLKSYIQQLESMEEIHQAKILMLETEIIILEKQNKY